MPSTTSDTAVVPGFKSFMATSGNPRHCKIVGTLGPASSSEEVQKKLIEAGLDIARLNFSHGSHEDHKKNIEQIRRISQECGRNVALLQDLQGPKIRTGQVLDGKLTVVKDQKYILAYGVEQTDPLIIPIDYSELVKDVAIGQRVLMDDGLLSFKIEDIQDQNVHVTCEVGGTLKSRKGVNFPEAKLSLPALTEKDSKDLLFGVSQGVDFVALSFVQDAKDIIQVKEMITALGADIPVIAKIEKIPAMDEIDAIAKVSDGLMVARGDLGVEASVEKVPGYQKKIVEVAAQHSIPVIIATQMLESMIENPRATLAEVADVANGVLDGADCVMLSGEVAAGDYPVECVRTMSDIITEVEQWTFTKKERVVEHAETSADKWLEHEAIAKAACEAADALNAKAIVCLTLTGSVARIVSSWRPHTPVIAISPRKDVIQRLTMVWGVYGMINPLFYNTDVLLQDLPQLLKSLKIVEKDDIIIITAGIPITQMKPTNMIKINRIT
jgi:pyruvate kinase